MKVDTSSHKHFTNFGLHRLYTQRFPCDLPLLFSSQVRRKERNLVNVLDLEDFIKERERVERKRTFSIEKDLNYKVKERDIDHLSHFFFFCPDTCFVRYGIKRRWFIFVLEQRRCGSFPVSYRTSKDTKRNYFVVTSLQQNKLRAVYG